MFKKADNLFRVDDDDEFSIYMSVTYSVFNWTLFNSWKKGNYDVFIKKKWNSLIILHDDEIIIPALTSMNRYKLLTTIYKRYRFFFKMSITMHLLRLNIATKYHYYWDKIPEPWVRLYILEKGLLQRLMLIGNDDTLLFSFSHGQLINFINTTKCKNVKRVYITIMAKFIKKFSIILNKIKLSIIFMFKGRMGWLSLFFKQLYLITGSDEPFNGVFTYMNFFFPLNTKSMNFKKFGRLKRKIQRRVLY